MIRCPLCEAPVYSRRNPLCSTCARPLPAEMLFSAGELARVEAEERERDRLRALREEFRRVRAEAMMRLDGGAGPGM